MRWVAILAVLASTSFGGCLEDDDTTDGPDGHYVYFNWGTTQSNCLNGVCTYGQNSEPFEETLKCTVEPTLSWDATGWKHGLVRVTVVDDEGAEVLTHTVSGNGKGAEVARGEPGDWTFRGYTQNANGNMQYRLTCVEPAAPAEP